MNFFKYPIPILGPAGMFQSQYKPTLGTHPKHRNTHLDLEIETSVAGPQANKGIPSGPILKTPILSSTERERRRKHCSFEL
jgi:hypothetical protein